MSNNPLNGTVLSHHEQGNEYCRFCDRSEMAYPILCDCGGLIHRDGEAGEDALDAMPEICDQCGAVVGSE